MATNGTDTEHITSAPEPDDPVLAMVSGAAPGRGIELLVEALRAVRVELPEARLRLALHRGHSQAYACSIACPMTITDTVRGRA